MLAIPEHVSLKHWRPKHDAWIQKDDLKLCPLCRDCPVIGGPWLLDLGSDSPELEIHGDFPELEEGWWAVCRNRHWPLCCQLMVNYDEDWNGQNWTEYTFHEGEKRRSERGGFHFSSMLTFTLHQSKGLTIFDGQSALLSIPTIHKSRVERVKQLGSDEMDFNIDTPIDVLEMGIHLLQHQRKTFHSFA